MNVKPPCEHGLLRSKCTTCERVRHTRYKRGWRMKRQKSGRGTATTMVTAQVQYFKPSGKFYTESPWELPKGTLTYNAVQRLRGLASNGGPGALPGLSSRTEGWDGYILVEVEGVPAVLEVHR